MALYRCLPTAARKQLQQSAKIKLVKVKKNTRKLDFHKIRTHENFLLYGVLLATHNALPQSVKKTGNYVNKVRTK